MKELIIIGIEPYMVFETNDYFVALSHNKLTGMRGKSSNYNVTYDDNGNKGFFNSNVFYLSLKTFDEVMDLYIT